MSEFLPHEPGVSLIIAWLPNAGANDIIFMSEGYPPYKDEHFSIRKIRHKNNLRFRDLRKAAIEAMAGRAQVKEDWIKAVIEKPEKVEIQSDGRIRKRARISEVGKYLRVILLEDGETVHNAFFDRSYKGE